MFESQRVEALIKDTVGDGDGKLYRRLQFEHWLMARLRIEKAELAAAAWQKMKPEEKQRLWQELRDGLDQWGELVTENQAEATVQ